MSTLKNTGNVLNRNSLGTKVENVRYVDMISAMKRWTFIILILKKKIFHYLDNISP